MAIGEIYELTDRQTFGNREIVNRYHYRNVNEAGTAEDLALAYVGDVLPFVTPLQTVNLNHFAINVINYDDPGDFIEYAIDIDGNSTSTGDDMPPFLACRFVLHRASRDVRNGSKRYAGLREQDVVADNVTAGYKGRMVNLADALELNITSPVTGEFELVIYGAVTPNRPTPIVVGVTGVSALFSVTTQNSRKFWVGS